MNIKLTTSAALIGALSLPVAGYTAETSPNTGLKTERSATKTVVQDSVITTKIKAAMAKDKEVSALNIKVDTDNKGVVTLSGNAKSKAEAEKAVSLARSVDGVVSVENNIQIASSR